MGKALGHRHSAKKGDLRPDSPMAEIRHRNDRPAADPQHMLEHDPGLAGGLQSLRQDHIVEGVVRVIDEVGVGVALNDGEPFRHAIVNALLRKLYSSSVDISLFDQEPQQIAVAAADVEYARTGRDEFGHAQKIDARRGKGPGKGQAMPLARAAASMKPRVVSSRSGTSSRKASCPRSVSISTNETEAPPALRARTIARESLVGKSQSEVKETTQKRVRESLNALASDPP